MSLQGKTVRIIVHEPENWDKNNLFGTIISDRDGKKLLLQLTEKIVGKEITSDILRRRNRRKNQNLTKKNKICQTVIVNIAELKVQAFRV